MIGYSSFSRLQSGEFSSVSGGSGEGFVSGG